MTELESEKTYTCDGPGCSQTLHILLCGIDPDTPGKREEDHLRAAGWIVYEGLEKEGHVCGPVCERRFLARLHDESFPARIREGKYLENRG